MNALTFVLYGLCVQQEEEQKVHLVVQSSTVQGQTLSFIYRIHLAILELTFQMRVLQVYYVILLKHKYIIHIFQYNIKFLCIHCVIIFPLLNPSG